MGSGDDFLNQIVAAWLKRQDDVLKYSGEPTWRVLEDKLEKLGHTEIATSIRRRAQHGGEREQQQDGISPVAPSTDSLTDDQQQPTSLSGQLCDPHQTSAPISSQSMTLSKQECDQPCVSKVSFEEPPAPKRTKVHQQSIREQSSTQQLTDAASQELKPLATSMETVTIPTTFIESFSGHHTSSQAQLTEKEGLLSTILPQSMNSSFLPTSTSATSTTVSAMPHQATSHSLPLVPNFHSNHPKALPNIANLKSISADKASEAFRKHRADLLVAVTDPLILANSLYSYSIISRETLNRVKLLTLTPAEKNMEIFDAIEAQIKTNPSSFVTLLDILNDDSQLCIIAGQLQQSYHQICASKASNLRGALEQTSLTATRQLNRFLMDVYKSLPQVHDMKFPRLPEKTFITLAVIEKELVSRADADIFTKGTLHGHADEILKKKKPIDMEAVLEPPEGQQNIKCVFVEGAPGVGKSTFALEFCRLQDKLEIYSLTLLLRLREKRVQGIQSVGDLFYQNDDLQQAVTKEIVACEGKTVLFVLDGFDELPSNLRKESFIVELIQGKHLPECTILVTSRPSATADLHFSCKSQIHKHIEILGFTHKCIQQYAESMLSDRPTVLQDFLKYISNNPAIHGMMYIPLNSAIVLEIYTKAKRTVGTPVPRTMTQLYTELCLMLLRKYLIENNDPLADHLQGRLEDIPNELREKVLKLGKLALEGALKQQITFEQLPDGCVDLGFMNVTTELYLGMKSVVSYSFLHLTLQEFLAAFYVSQLSCVEQKLLFIENLLIGEDIMFFYKRADSHLDVLWRFLAGLTGFKGIGWKLVHRATLQNRSYNVYHPLLVRCLLEIQNEQIIKIACDRNVIKQHLALKDDVYYPGHLGQPHTRLIMSTVRTPFDCYAVGYCVAASGCEWSTSLVNIGGNETVEMLGRGLHSVGEVSGHLRVLGVVRNSLTLEAITHFSKFPPKILNNISKLSLYDNQLNKDALDCLAGTLSHMANLTSLDVSKNPINPGGAVKLFQELTNTKKIEELCVQEVNLGTSDIHTLCQLLRSRVHLKKLKIGDKSMSLDNVALLVETLLSLSSLEKLELWWISYTLVSAEKLKLLENNTNLANLVLMNNFVGINLALPYLAKALHKNESLKSLGVMSSEPRFSTTDTGSNIDCSGEYDIRTDSIKALSEMLVANSTLTVLQIATSKLTRDDILILSDALSHNSTLEHLGLTNVVDKRITSSMRRLV